MRKKKSLLENERFKAKHPKAFIVEHLTPLRSKVAHMLRHDENIAKTWTIDGLFKVVKRGADSEARPISIDSGPAKETWLVRGKDPETCF